MRSIVALILGLSACEGDVRRHDDGDGSRSNTGPTPTIVLTAPEDGAERNSPTVRAMYEVQNIQLDETNIDGAPEDGIGHVHVYVDGDLVGETAALSWPIDSLKEGTHDIEVRLAENDHIEVGEGSIVTIETVRLRVGLETPTGVPTTP